VVRAKETGDAGEDKGPVIGRSGFTVSYTRRVYSADSIRRNEQYTWTYSPENEVIAIAGR
jgi:hypothetical protein